MNRFIAVEKTFERDGAIYVRVNGGLLCYAAEHVDVGEHLVLDYESGKLRRPRQGFAAMSVAEQREVARKGGEAAHAQGTAHEFTPEEARVAGAKGGTKVAQDREHMAAIGRRGAAARWAKFREARA